MIETMVCGYNVYKEIWCAAVGEELSCIREVENYCDPFAVGRPKKDIVGMFDGLSFGGSELSDSLALITCFTSVLADSMDNNGTVVDRGPHGSGSLVVSLDALK